ncbi:MAG: hypothetical protein J4451_00470 [DPANN group archaeon]|nr:hypothetical protein [DPANN group archaeon]
MVKIQKSKKIISLEELAWLIIGLVFGYLAGIGAPFFVVALPIGAFIIWIASYLKRKTLW